MRALNITPQGTAPGSGPPSVQGQSIPGAGGLPSDIETEYSATAHERTTPAEQNTGRGMSRRRAPTIGYQGASSLNQFMHYPYVPQWTKLVLVDTLRGLQAWQVHSLKAVGENSMGLTGEVSPCSCMLHCSRLLLKVHSPSYQFSFPATVALTADHETTFSLALWCPLNAWRVKNVTLKLLRTITSSTSFGKLYLERDNEVTLDGRPVLELRSFGDAVGLKTPPRDEYGADAFDGDVNTYSASSSYSCEGVLCISSGWKQSGKEIDEASNIVFLSKDTPNTFAKSTQKGCLLTTPTFAFRAVTVEVS